MTPDSFTNPHSPRRTHRESKLVEWSDVIGRCRAASQLALRGESYSTEDRADCAAHLTALVAERAGVGKVDADERPSGRTTVFDPARETRRTYVLRLLRYIDAAERHAVPMEDRARHVPLRSVGMDFLVKRGAHYRESLDARRKREAEDMLRQPDEWTPFLPVRGETLPTPENARADVLRFIGRTVPMEARTVPMAIALYTAARDGEHGSGADLAGELGMTPTAYRKARSRGMAALLEIIDADTARERCGAAVSSRVHVDAPENPRGLVPRARYTRSRALGLSEWRHRGTETLRRSSGRNGSTAVHVYPAVSSTLYERKVRTVRPWNGRKRSTWVERMTPGRATERSRARLATAARLTRERTAAAPLAERNARRLAAGIAPLRAAA